MAQDEALPKVLKGRKDPVWDCQGCALQGNWASRICCRRCGARPSKKVFDAALAEHKRAQMEKAAKNYGRGNSNKQYWRWSAPTPPWANSSNWPKPGEKSSSTPSSNGSADQWQQPPGVPEELWNQVLEKASEHRQAEEKKQESKPKTAKQLPGAVDAARWALRNKQQQLEKAKDRQQKAPEEAETHHAAIAGLQVDLEKALAAQAEAIQLAAGEGQPSPGAAASFECVLPRIKCENLAAKARQLMEELRRHDEQQKQQEVREQQAAAEAARPDAEPPVVEIEEAEMELDLETADDDALAAMVGSFPKLAKPSGADELHEWRILVKDKIAGHNESQRAFRAAAAKGGVLKRKLKGKTAASKKPG